MNDLAPAQIFPFRFSLNPGDIRPHLIEFAKKNLSDIGIVNQRFARRQTGAKARFVRVVGETNHHSAKGRPKKVANGLGLDAVDELQGVKHLPFDLGAEEWKT
jgi:hypothetical protein